MSIETRNNENLIYYLTEFRRRLLFCLMSLAILACVCFYFSNALYTWLALPLLKQLSHGEQLIATHIISPFFVPFELSFFVALFFAAPIFLYQVWAFITPALYRHEKRLIFPLLLLSNLLFYSGIAFAYFVVFPILFRFLTHTKPAGVLLSPDIAQYFEFTLKLFFLCGIMFEVPIVIVVLIWTGIVTRQQLIQFRPYAIVLAFVIGMLITPPDVLSQTLLAVPLWLLFEIGIVMSFFLKKS